MYWEEITMHRKVTLSSLEEGEKGRVHCFGDMLCIRDRLRSLGLVEGAETMCLHKGASGSISAYLICGAVIAIRREDAAKVIIEI